MKPLATLSLAAAALSLPLLIVGCGTSSPSVTANATTFDFGNVALHTIENRVVVTLSNSGSSSATLGASLSGDPSFTIDSPVSCGTTLGADGSCSIVVFYSPQKTGTETAKLQIGESGGTSATQTIELTGTGTTLSAGEGMVTATNNPLVALYTYAPTGSGTVRVSFGTTTSYGQNTWAVTPTNGDPVSIYVAGMKANTTYHMRAIEDLTSGGTVEDQDHSFTTGSFPASILPTITTTTASGATPQPGIELMSVASSPTPGYLQAYATNLQGNIIWGYNYADRVNSGPFLTIVQPVKLLPNGDMIVVLSFGSSAVLDSSDDHVITPPAGATDLVREIDLAGNPIKQITMDQLNSELAAAGYNLHLYDFHHDVTVLPNGHWIVLASTIQSETGLTGEPSPENVLGDVIIDLNTNLKPVWVWNEFDHLDLNRHPMQFPDWTHTNAVLYSPTDGNLVVSIRHQNWIIKINYDNGQGNGDILWKLGYQGDFTLQNGTSPIDWFYAQHDPSFIGSSTAGNFNITMMDNGDDRVDSSGNVCGSSAFPCYSTIPILNVNTSTKTATLKFNYKVPTADYNNWGGNAEVLANGDLEFDLCTLNDRYSSEIDEIIPTSTPQTVWTMQESGANPYRAKRIPSLYPGVQW